MKKNARENLETEVIGFDFDAVRSAARSAWEQALSAITVKGGNTDDLKNFYTAMYHSMVVPNVVSDVNGEYRRHNMEIGAIAKRQSAIFYIFALGYFPCMESVDDFD